MSSGAGFRSLYLIQGERPQLMDLGLAKNFRVDAIELRQSPLLDRAPPPMSRLVLKSTVKTSGRLTARCEWIRMCHG